ncbi:hypothetical protein [Paenibacillus sp. NPDC093718]|uniref:hypothetical protein n=1 Tax=Paenibacillus sp. NPDC093718 TaxID=3390601 RepID=UPI003D0605DE
MMDDCNKGSNSKNNETENDQWISEVDQILHKMIDKLDVAYGIVRENNNHEEPTSWSIRIEDSETVLTPVILKEYMSWNIIWQEALTVFLCERFPNYT